MRKNLFIIFFILQLFLLKSDDSSINLNIYRSKTHEDKTGDLTPLVISVSSDDVKKKTTYADFIFVVDISGSMWGEPMELVKDTLSYIVNQTSENDNIALITFDDDAYLNQPLTKMTEANKNILRSKINNLNPYYGTNIYSGLSKGLEQVTKDYRGGDRVCAIILLSDGVDNWGGADTKFASLINSGEKKNYIFTTHAFGYGSYHDPILMDKISKIRDGAYFFVKEFAQVKKDFIKIYGALSTTIDNNLELQAISNFKITKVYGMEDMYQSSLTKTKPYIFNANLLQVVGGKTYSFVALVDIPKETEYGTPVLNATIVGKNIHATYLWDNYIHPAAYEEYIRCIAFTIIVDGYTGGTVNGLVIIQNGIAWLKLNYDGYFNWEGVLSETIYDLKSFNTYGKANILSKLRELKTQKIGTHFSEDNTFIDELVKDANDIVLESNDENQIVAEQTINTDNTKNYYYFYLKEGQAELNGIHFSGEHSSFMIYSDEVDKITLKPLTASFLYYYNSEKKGVRVQNKVDIGRGGKFIFKKDFPFDFYSSVDGKNDVLFNIQLLNLEYSNPENEIPSFEILAYVVPETMVNTLANQNYNYKPSSKVFYGYYDKGTRIGKLLIKKTDISSNINYSSAKNFLYIIVQKTSSSKIQYKKVEGQFSFIEMNYRSRNIPEGFYIFNNFVPGEKNPHLYTILMDQTPGKETRIEFASSGSELNCKILKSNNYVIGSEELYLDYNEYEIRRESRLGKTYIYVTQSNIPNKLINEIKVSIFSTNEGKAAGNDISKLEYSLRYTRETDNGLYDYKDLNEKYCEVKIAENIANKEKISLDFYPIKTKKLEESSYVKEKTRFYLKGFAFDKKKEGIKGTVSLLDKNIPDILIEKNMVNEDKLTINLDANRAKNYFFALYTISQRTGEIIGYQVHKLYKIAKDIVITDTNTYENEYNNNLALDFKVANEITKSHLLIQITDLDDGESLTIQATVNGEVFEAQNKVLIPKEKCKGKEVNLAIKLNYGDENEYYLNIYMVNKLVIESDIINSKTYSIEYPLHEDSEFPKVVNLYDGNIYAISSVVGVQKTKASKLNNEGIPIYDHATINIGYTADANLVQPNNLDYYVLTYHNKQDLSGSIAKETIVNLKDHNSIIRSTERKDYIYEKTSSVALQNGNILIAGIKHISTFGEQTVAEINIYNPKTGVIGNGLSINAHSKYISCYEQSKNYVNCLYVSDENEFVSKLKLKEIFVDMNTLTDKRDRVIKSFYTPFNFLKAIRYNDKEGIILFQTGQNQKGCKYGDTGKDLYYYHIKIVPENDLVQIKRYEYLYDNCLYSEDKQNAEYYNADIAILSHHKVFAVCETAPDKFRGFIIYQNQVKYEDFNFNNFGANMVKTPVFAKFGKSLGLFYTSINDHLRKSVKYQIINYPDCFDYRKSYLLLPQTFTKEVDFWGKVFLSNPYPSNIKEDIKVRFRPFDGVSITESTSKLQLLSDMDYPASLNLIIKSEGKTGLYNIEYTATREDPMDGIILGKTCKMSIYTPQCLEQCASCTEMGSEEHHMCIGCKEGPYYYEADPDAINEGYGLPHFCRKCDIACASCKGPFLDYVPTTNCIKCDYENNYFHFEDYEPTCISNETKEYWENVTHYGLYLDKSPGEEHKDQWRWRKCHKNCAQCFEKGDDIDNKCFTCKKELYFFCNQTLENGGIPGSCHSDCEGNGFFITVQEDREKCCPCSSHCRKCINETQCQNCYPPFFRTKNEFENETICEPECGYCLAEDRNKWECVNCKTDYPEPLYTLNKSCVEEIPFIESIQRYHHIIDDKCNLFHGCKEGCHKCDPWYSDECTECNASYYKEDFYGLEQPATFKCFESDTCKGIKPYIHDERKQIGGVPKNVEGTNVCWNCKLRDGNYRLPDEFICADKINRTYVDIDEYNKLSYCYFRCQECDYWGNMLIMNCSSCRDPTLYSNTVKIGDYYNCYRKPPKCGIFPFYHDYDLGDELGLDDCGEKCDICMTNFTCPPNLPFVVLDTRECVEYCPLINVLDKSCEFHDKRQGMLLLENPFGLKNKYDFLNNMIYLRNITSNKYFEYITKSFSVDIADIQKGIDEYAKNGKLPQLPESHVIIGNNIKIELTSVRLELQKLKKIESGELTQLEASILDLSECETYLKKTFKLSHEEELIIIKGDIFDEISKYFATTKIEYQLFSFSMGAFLPLGLCKDAKIPVRTYSPFNITSFAKKIQNKMANVIDSEYNPFDPNSDFYNDVCTPFTDENGNDVLLFYRRNKYFNKEYNLCEDGCDFLGYNQTIKMYTCNCTIKKEINDQSSYEVKPMIVPDDFYTKKEEYSNIKVFKCASQVFSKKGQTKNYGSYILLALFFCFIGVIIFYFIKGKSGLTVIFENLNKVKKEDNNNIPANPPKNPGKETEDTEVQENKAGYGVFVKKKEQNPENIQKDFEMTDEDANYLDYEKAKIFDKRGYKSYWWSLVKLKQPFIFTFYTFTDHNLRLVKIALLILFISFYFAFTALFFNDEIMRDIYEYKGSTLAAIHVTNIILASLCCLIMNFIIRFISLSERDINKALPEKNPDNRKAILEGIRLKLKTKIIILFIISGLLLALCWYYVAAFCAVFKNSQGHYLLNVLWTFMICNLWPFVTSLIAPIFRIKSLKDGKSPCMYKFSQIIAYF